MIGVTAMPLGESREAEGGSRRGPLWAVRVGEAANPGPTTCSSAVSECTAQAAITKAHVAQNLLEEKLRAANPEVKDEAKLKVSFEESAAPDDDPEKARVAKILGRRAAERRKARSWEAWSQQGPEDKAKDKGAVKSRKGGELGSLERTAKARHEQGLGPEDHESGGGAHRRRGKAESSKTCNQQGHKEEGTVKDNGGG